MASESHDKTRDESAYAASRADVPEAPPGEPDSPGRDSSPPDPPGAAPPVEDETLIEMLEQLNATLDSARFAFSEHQQISGFSPPLPEPEPETAPPRPWPRSAGPLLAAMLGVCAGAAGLVLIRPLWSEMQVPSPRAEAVDPPARESRIARTPQMVAPAGGTISPEPLPDAKPAKPFQERAPRAAHRVSAALALGGEVAAPMADVDAANAAAPAAASDFRDKPDFEDKDETLSMPVPEPESRAAALEERRSPLTAREEAALMARGDGFLGHGDFASARLVYEHAARRGSANAMYALARSYDPRFIAERNVIGIKPDGKTALDWYTRAAGAGHERAAATASEMERRNER